MPLDIRNDANITYQFNLHEVEGVADALLFTLAENGISTEVAVAGLALGLGKLLSVASPMDEEREIAFIQAALNWGGLYFVEGMAN